jgi:hypothetical protein
MDVDTGVSLFQSYVGFKSQLLLQCETQERDTFLENWCYNINQQMADDSFATYIVKTSCHDPDYDLQRMKRYFYARSSFGTFNYQLFHRS